MQVEIKEELYNKLVLLGIIALNNDKTRAHNVGASDYATKIIQPWSVWLDWGLNPWDADIVKRICRHKTGEDERVKYEKIIHICEERLRQIAAKDVVIKDDIVL